MNDVLNSQGYTQAAWWNRIPVGAWCLMFGIAVFANVLVGYGARKVRVKLFMMLPLVVSVSFFLIADIESPRRGMIRVHPQNLESLRAGLGE
jgi:purine-cytosine permease-like protein